LKVKTKKQERISLYHDLKESYCFKLKKITMRFSETEGTFRLYAVTGTNTIAFGIDCDEADMKDLLGFTVEKEYYDTDNNHIRVTVMGFKVFRERIENPVRGGVNPGVCHEIRQQEPR